MTYPSFPSIKLLMPLKRKPMWSSLKQKAISGRQTRISLWSYPCWQYEVKTEVLRTASAFAEYQSLVGFFNSLNAGVGMFTYNDPSDNTATAQGFGVGDGATTVFQLVRTLGGYTEPVFAPITVSISAQTSGGTTAVSSSAYSIGPTGAVTFTTAPAAGTTVLWTGTFAWLCQFDDDEMATQQDFASIWSADGIKFTTVKL